MTEKPDQHEQRRKARRHRRRILVTYLLFKKTQRYLPPVVRGLAGLVLVLLGFVGFLPVLGFWMIPLGLAVLATDIPPMKRWVRARLSRHRAARSKDFN